MRLTDHITIEVSELKEFVLVQTTSGTTKLDASNLNQLMRELNSLFFEISPLSHLLWQFIKNPRPEVMEKILGHFESDPTISDCFQEYLTHIESQINKKLSLIYTQISGEEQPSEEVKDSLKYWEIRRRGVTQSKNQWQAHHNPKEFLITLQNILL